MKTILTALREEDKATDEEARTIARALGGTTIASAIAPDELSESAGNTPLVVNEPPVVPNEEPSEVPTGN